MKNERKRRIKFTPIALAAWLALGQPLSQAASVSWTHNGSGFWDLAANWSSGLPLDGDDITLSTAAVSTVSFRSDSFYAGALNIASAKTTLAVTAGQFAVSGAFNNLGTLSVGNASFNFLGTSFSNSGQLKVLAGGIVNLYGSLTTAGLGSFSSISGGTLNLMGTLDNRGSTLTFSPATGSMSLADGTIKGGTVQLSGSNGLRFDGYNPYTDNFGGLLDGVTVRGTLNVVQDGLARLQVRNGLTLRSEDGSGPGVLNVANSAFGDTAVVSFYDTQTFDNATINLGRDGHVGMEGDGTLTLGRGSGVQGRGSIGFPWFLGGTSHLVNNGLISANANAALSIKNSGNFSNTGTLSASNGGILDIAPGGNWSNSGLIKVLAGGTVNLFGNLPVASLGSFSNIAGGTLNLIGTLDNTGTTLAFTPATGSMSLAGGTIKGGTVLQSGGNGLNFDGSTPYSSGFGGTLDGVTVRGALNVNSTANRSIAGLRIKNGLTLRSEDGTGPGVLNVGTVTGTYFAFASFYDTQTFNNATINLGSPNGDGHVYTDGDGTLTLGSGVVVQGRGDIGRGLFVGGTSHLVNHGLIRASLNGLLTINNGGNFSNFGTLSAGEGGTLTIMPGGGWNNGGLIKVLADGTVNLGGSLTTSSLGSFSNIAGGRLNLVGTLDNRGSTLAFTPANGSMSMADGTITGGTVQQTGNHGLSINAYNPVSEADGGTLDGVTVRGALNVNNSPGGGRAALRIRNGLTLRSEDGTGPGVLNVGTVTMGNTAVAAFYDTQTFDNATINLGSPTRAAQLAVQGGTLTLGNGAVVQGRGDLGRFYFPDTVGGPPELVNNGLIRANLNGTLTINISGNFSNNGTLSASDGGTLNIAPFGKFSNYANHTLTGGSYRVSDGSRLTFANADIRTNAADLVLDGVDTAVLNSSDGSDALARLAKNAATGRFTILNGRNFTSAAGFVNAGMVDVGASSLFTGADSFNNQAGAKLQLAAGSFTASSLANAGLISGFGALATAVNNSGSGKVLASGGTLTLAAGAQGNTGQLAGAVGSTLSLGATSNAATLELLGGQLALAANDLTVFQDYDNANFGVGNAFNRRAGLSGTGQILAAGTTQQVLTGALVQNGNAAAATLALPNIRVGTGGITTSFTVNNIGSGGPALRGALQTSGITASGLSGTGVTAQNWGALAQGEAGQTFDISFNPSAGQALAGQRLQLVTNFDNVAGQILQISGSAFNLASASAVAPATVTLAAQRVDGLLAQTLSLTNTAPANAFSEALNATIVASGAATVSGAVSLLAAGTTSRALTVGVDTTTPGAKMGLASIALASDGTGSSGLAVYGLAGQQVAVAGHVYAPAVARLNTPAVQFGTVRVGDVVAARPVSVSNVAGGALTDTLRASISMSIGSSGAAFSTAGLASAVTAGDSDSQALTVRLNTATAGVFNGTASVNFVSQNTEMADLALAPAEVALDAQVNNLAAATLGKAAGAGSFSSALGSYSLNFGSLLLGAGSLHTGLSLRNSASGTADSLGGSFDLSGVLPGDVFGVSGFSAFAGLNAGDSLAGLTVNFASSVVGAFERVIVLSAYSANGSGPDLAMVPVRLHLQGTVLAAAVPEPGTWVLMVGGLALLVGVTLRRKQAV